MRSTIYLAAADGEYPATYVPDADLGEAIEVEVTSGYPGGVRVENAETGKRIDLSAPGDRWLAMKLHEQYLRDDS